MTTLFLISCYPSAKLRKQRFYSGIDLFELLIAHFVLCNQFRLIFPYPQDLRGGKAGKSNVSGEPGQLILANGVVQIIYLGPPDLMQ